MKTPTFWNRAHKAMIAACALAMLTGGAGAATAQSQAQEAHSTVTSQVAPAAAMDIPRGCSGEVTGRKATLFCVPGAGIKEFQAMVVCEHNSGAIILPGQIRKPRLVPPAFSSRECAPGSKVIRLTGIAYR